MGLGGTEILVLILLIVLLFGGKRLPELGKALGQSVINFKKGVKENPVEPKIED